MSSASEGEVSRDPAAPRSRRELIRTGAGAALAGLLGVFGVAQVTSAKNGQSVRAGERTSASRTTTLATSADPGLDVRSTASQDVVAGRFLAEGRGTALEARAPGRNAVALRTRGRLEFGERSGTNQVSGGAEFVIPVAGALTDTTFVLATLQDHHPGIHVESATVLDADEGLIVVRLNQALAEPATVGWIVLD